jgi:hypothetical protein
MSPQLVPLEELGPQLGGGNAETAAARLAATGLPAPVSDWQGRPCVQAAVAAKAVAEYRDEVESAEARRRGYELYLAEQRRQATGQEAAEKAMLAHYEAGCREIAANYAGFVAVGTVPRYGPAEQAAGSAARHEAVTDFDRKHPTVALEHWEG